MCQSLEYLDAVWLKAEWAETASKYIYYGSAFEANARLLSLCESGANVFNVSP